MEYTINKKNQEEPNAEAMVWIERAIQLRNENKKLLEQMQINSEKFNFLKRCLYTKYKIQFKKPNKIDH